MQNVFHPQIEHFLACANETSFVKAAFKIGISQPALSTSIKKLEENLEAALFTRGKRGIQLTPEGLALFKTLSDAQGTLRERVLRSVRREKTSLLRIGCTGHLASRYLLDVLENVKSELPIVHLYTSTSLDCYERVMDGEVEFSFVAWSSKPKRLEFMRIVDEPVEFVGLKKAFPNLPKVKTFQELKKYPWIDLPKPQRDWTSLLEPDQPGYLVRDIRILRDIVLRGLAVGYLQMSFFNAEEKKKLAIAPVPPFYPDSAVYVVYKRNLSEESRGFLGRLVAEFKTEAKRKENR